MPGRKTRFVTVTSTPVQGDDSWVKLLKPTKGELDAAREPIQELESRVRELEQSGAPAREIQAAREAFEEKSTEMFEQWVIEWNWVDDDANPLPQPQDVESPFDLLTVAELQFIIRQFATDSEKKD